MTPPSIINVGLGGTLSRLGARASTPAEVAALFRGIRAHRLVLYAHGGLVSEAKGLEIAGQLAERFGDAHPVFIVWETDALNGLAEAWGPKASRAVRFLQDRLVARLLPRLVVAGGARGGAVVRPGEDPAIRGPAPGLQLTDRLLDGVTDEVEADLQADFTEDDDLGRLDAVEVSQALGPEAQAELRVDGARGILLPTFLAYRCASAARRVLRRFRDGTHHDVGPTVLEELAREFVVGTMGKASWEGMKARAENMWRTPNASNDPAGPHILQGLREWQLRTQGTIDLVGHSAGSILMCHLLAAASETGLRFRNLALLAPACTMELFAHRIVDAKPAPIENVYVFALSDELERADTCLHLYPRSLLYLVSGLFEDPPAKPILGMARYWTDPRTPESVRAFLAKAKTITSVTSSGVPFGCTSRTHGGFDEDEPTLVSLKSIVGTSHAT